MLMNIFLCKGFRRKADGRRTSYAGEKVEMSGIIMQKDVIFPVNFSFYYIK